MYVAESYVAYSTALVGFTCKMSSFLMSGEAGIPPFPVVLNLRLQEDCVLGPDEDYLKLDQKLEMEELLLYF